MMKLLVISVTEHIPQNKVIHTITHMTLNTINGVLEVSILFETPMFCDMKFHPNAHVLPPNASTSTSIHPLFIHLRLLPWL